jgi:hypothetical protein
MYTTRRIYWVEPNSGSVVDYSETMDRRFVYQGHVLPIIQGTATMDDSPGRREDHRHRADGGAALPLVHRTLPLVFVPLGLVCLVAGSVLVVRRNRRRDADDVELPERTLTGAGT